MSSNTDPSRLPSSSSTAKKTFSKNELYASLSVYQDGGKAPNNSRIPKSLREPSFINFLTTVSERYYQYSTKTTGKNNVGRVMAAAEIDTLIQNRALTLFGGGINKKIKSKTPEKRRRARKRPRVLSNKMSAQSRIQLWVTLGKLGARWNHLLLNGLRRIEVCGEELSREDQRSLASAVAECELVGAPARIVQCPGNENFVGKDGFVAGDTERAWRLLVLLKKSGSPRTVVIPKRRGEIAIQVKVPQKVNGGHGIQLTETVSVLLR